MPRGIASFAPSTKWNLDRALWNPGLSAKTVLGCSLCLSTLVLCLVYLCLFRFKWYDSCRLWQRRCVHDACSSTPYNIIQHVNSLFESAISYDVSWGHRAICSICIMVGMNFALSMGCRAICYEPVGFCKVEAGLFCSLALHDNELNFI